MLLELGRFVVDDFKEFVGEDDPEITEPRRVRPLQSESTKDILFASSRFNARDIYDSLGAILLFRAMTDERLSTSQNNQSDNRRISN